MTEVFGRVHDLESARAGNGLPDPSGEPDGSWIRTASGAAVWVPSVTASEIDFVPVGTISATDVQAAIAEVAAEASGAVSSVFTRTGAVTAATSDYDAVQVDFTPAGTIAATNTQAAVEEVATEAASALAAHIGDTSDAHDGSAISFVPAGTISATDVQAAIEEVAAEAGGGVPTSRTLTAGAALTGGGDLSANRTFDVAVDGSTIEISSDALRVKADGITANEIAAGAVGASELASTAVTPATYGDATHVGQFTVDADGRITAAADVAITGSGITKVPASYYRRTAGDYSLNNFSSFAAIDATNLNRTLAAATGDILEITLTSRYGAEAVNAFIDAATIVSSAAVNYVSGGAGNSGDFGVAGWVGLSGVSNTLGGSVFYTVQAGDISGGNVTVRLMYRTGSAAVKTLRAGTAQNDALFYGVKNLLH